MRELKFRAWHKKEKWMDGVWEWDIEHEILCFTRHNKAEMKDCVIMQSTGLQDKKGQEVYEGDIIQISFFTPSWDGGRYNNFKARIEFVGGSFWFVGIDSNITDCNWHFYNAAEREVIGNIYENPEYNQKDIVNGR